MPVNIGYDDPWKFSKKDKTLTSYDNHSILVVNVIVKG